MKIIRTPQAIARKTLLMIAIFVAASALGYLFRYLGFPDTNTVVVYLLSVLITAWLTRSFVFGFLASLFSTISFNYFFAEPHYSFYVSDPNYIITFITMIVTAFITSALTSHAKQSALAAQNKEAETRSIYNLINHLTGAKDMRGIADIAVTEIGNCFGCDAACLCFDEEGMPERSFVQRAPGGTHVRREVDREMGEMCTDHYVRPEFCDWPISGSEGVLGLIRIPRECAQAMSESQVRLLRSMIEDVALAMDRFRAASQRIKSGEETVKERYRANLLRAISHDLRTPLSSIIGTSEMLMSMTERSDPRYALAGGIRNDADWLHSLVENILNLTRLQDGKLALKKQLEAAEEVIGSAVNRIAQRFPDYDITVSAPHELLLVPMDARLIEQVIINLLDNAIKHTNPDGEISISAKLDRDTNRAVFAVKDGGTGIREGDLPQIFQMFYTADAERADARHGIGLGLAICETIVKAHGGSIEAHNRTDGPGAEFIFALPMEDEQSE